MHGGARLDAPGRWRRLVVTPPVEPPGPDVTGDVARYRRWLAGRSRPATRDAPSGDRGRAVGAGGDPPPHRPPVAVVVVVRHGDRAGLARLVASLQGQRHRRWRLVAACVGARAEAAVRRSAPRRWALRRRLTVVRCAAAASDAEAASHALGRAVRAAPVVLVVGEGDELVPHALAALAEAVAGGAAVVYADDDTLDADGAPLSPRLKPDWSPDLLLATDYVGRPVALDAAVVGVLGGARAETGEAWEYDLVVRACEGGRVVAHLPDVLLHRGEDPAVPFSAAARVVADALARRGEPGEVEPGATPRTCSVRRPVPARCRVSIVVPFRDGAALVRRCVTSVLRTADHAALELLLVDNGSEEPETRALVARLAALDRVRVLEDPRPFNWAALNNAAARHADGDVLVFLNDDVEARRQGWLGALLEQALRPDVGAAGARLLYPTGEVQHAGVVVGLGGAAGHVLRGLPGDRPGYLDQAVVVRDVSAVTGACLATRRACFEEMSGFDEDMALDLNDVDYCLRLGRAGYRTVVTPLAELVHDESPTRGSSGNIASIGAFLRRWEGAVRAGDPYLNRNLTRMDGSCSLRRPDEERWWQTWRTNLDVATSA